MEIKDIRPIISEMKEVIKELDIFVSGDMLWDTAVRVFNSRNIEKNKNGNGNGEATENQVNVIKSLISQKKIKEVDTSNLSKFAASEIITKAIGK